PVRARPRPPRRSGAWPPPAPRRPRPRPRRRPPRPGPCGPSRPTAGRLTDDSPISCPCLTHSSTNCSARSSALSFCPWLGSAGHGRATFAAAGPSVSQRKLREGEEQLDAEFERIATQDDRKLRRDALELGVELFLALAQLPLVFDRLPPTTFPL